MKKAFIISYLILFFFVLATCAQKIDDKVIEIVPINFQEQVDLVKAKQIIDNTCLECHSATASMEDRLAPPLEAVKRRYLREYPAIEEFTTAISTFVTDPTEDKTLLRGAVRRFDVMPKQDFSEEDIIAVATYIYQFDLDKPEWFEEHYTERHGGNGHGMQGNGEGNHRRQGEGRQGQHGQGERMQGNKGNCDCGNCKRGNGNSEDQDQTRQHRRGQRGS